MTKSKKLIISLSIILAVVVIVLVTVVSVWAATSQTVTNQLTVRYTATNVSATMQADYRLAGSSTWQNMGSVSFSPTESSSSKSLTAKEIELTDSATYVFFRYTFTNNGSNDIKISSNETPAQTNMEIEYYIKSTDTTEDLDPTSMLIRPSSIVLSSGETQYVFVLVNVMDRSKDASFSGTFAWNLEHAPQQHDGGAGS